MKKLKDMGVDDNTIVVFTTDNGAENFTWPDGGQTPFAGGKGTALEGGFRVPAMLRWPGKVPAGKVENGIFSGLDWFPTFVAAAGNPNIADELLKGKQIGDRTYKVHLDGYDQTDLITGKGPSNAARDLLLHRRHALARCASTTTSTASPISRTAGSAARQGRLADPDQPSSRSVRAHRDCPTATRARSPSTTGSPTSSGASCSCSRRSARLAQTAIEFPPMQKGASFNLEAVKAQIEKADAIAHWQVATSKQRAPRNGALATCTL